MCDFAAMIQMAVQHAEAIDNAKRVNKEYKKLQEKEKVKLNAVFAENRRRQFAVNEESRLQKTDRIQQAEKEIGAVRVSIGELGATDASRMAFIRAVGFTEGEDVTRIDTNRIAKLNEIDAESLSARQATEDTLKKAYYTANSAWRQAIFGGISAGLQIGMNEFGQGSQESAAKNKTANASDANKK